MTVGRKARGHRLRRGAALAGLVLVAYGIVAYMLLPLGWEAWIERHPALDGNPRITTTADGHPGDPLNVALVGDGVDLKAAMAAAGWKEAVPLGVRSDLAIAADSLLDRADERAPVSSLYLFGRKEDVAFEKTAGSSPRQRHHVRFWRAPQDDRSGRPLWVGAATFDRSIGLSHTTGEITHHIAPDIDAERDGLFADLEAARLLSRLDRLKAFQTVTHGRNGGGDPWQTDGELWVGVLEAQPDCCAPTR